MKKILTIAIFCISIIGFSQEVKPTFVAEGDLVKATYFHNDGSISTEGYFKDKKLTGQWTRFDENGNKVQLGFYKEGKKVGKWSFWSKNSLQEVTYNNNNIDEVNLIKSATKFAVNK